MGDFSDITGLKLNQPWPAMPIKQQTAEIAYTSVLESAGATLPELKNGTAPTDSDHDGIPDDWENKNKLNKENPDDRNSVDSDGYTMLEKYLNSIK